MSDEPLIVTRRCAFDEIAAMCRDAAIAKSYPRQLAEIAGEMVVWLERHRIPGVAAMVLVLDSMDSFDGDAAAPKTLESGEMQFPEPITAGVFLLDNFDRLSFPARINGPSRGALLLTPFFALAANQRQKGVRINFIATDEQTVGAQISYADGKSAFAGEPVAVGYASRLGIEFPVEIDAALQAPREGPVDIDENFCRALESYNPTRH